MKNAGKIKQRTLLMACIGGMVILLFISIILLSSNICIASASSNIITKDLNFTIHEVVDNAGYSPTKNNQTTRFSNGKTQLGTITVSGDGFTMKEWNGYQAVALTGSELSFKYKQNITSSDYGGHTWHLRLDTNSVVCGHNIGEINNGGIIVLKSFNRGSSWVKATQSIKINGQEVLFTPSGEDIAQGVLYKFVSVAETYYTYRSGTKTNYIIWPFWSEEEPIFSDHVINLMQETIVYVASDTPVIGMYNDKTENYKLDLPEEVSDIEAEIIHKGVSLADNGISTTKVRLDFLKNKSHYIDYSYNGSSFKKAQDGQVLSEVGQYQIRVKSVFGMVKTYTIYIIDEKTIFESYFGEHIVSQEKRIYDSSSKLPIYCNGTTYSVNANSEFLPALYGSLSYFADEKAVNDGDAVITKWNGFHKFDGELKKNGYYAFEFTTGDVNDGNGDIACFSFLLKVQDKGSYAPTVNKQLLTSSERNINLNRTFFSVPVYSAGGGAYVFCFKDLKTAEDFSYQSELRFVEDFYAKDGLYFYKGENGNVKVPYNSKVELYDAVRKISKQNVSYATIDNTLQYGVMSLEEAIKNVENTSIKNDIYVVNSIQERDNLRSVDVILNGFKFTQAADYEVNKVVAKNVDTGEEITIPFEIVVDSVLPEKTAKYEITEYNWAGSNSYIVNFVTGNTAKINVSYTTTDGYASAKVDANNTVTINAKNEVKFIESIDEYDSETIVTISKLGYIKVLSLKDLAEKYLDEEGEYTITIKSRANYSYSFKIIIAENKEDEMQNISTSGIHLKSMTKDNVDNSFEHLDTNLTDKGSDNSADSQVDYFNDLTDKNINTSQNSKLVLIIGIPIAILIITYCIILTAIHFKRKKRV